MPVAMARWQYPFPFRTRKSSTSAPMILLKAGKQEAAGFFILNRGLCSGGPVGAPLFSSAGDNNVLPGFPHSVCSLFFTVVNILLFTQFFTFYFFSLLFCFRSFLIFLKKYKQKTEASELGVVNFIQKPFDSTTILGKIKTLLQAKAATT